MVHLLAFYNIACWFHEGGWYYSTMQIQNHSWAGFQWKHWLNQGWKWKGQFFVQSIKLHVWRITQVQLFTSFLNFKVSPCKYLAATDCQNPCFFILYIHPKSRKFTTHLWHKIDYLQMFNPNDKYPQIVILNFLGHISWIFIQWRTCRHHLQGCKCPSKF
jgi:hypothetical protein